MPVVELNLNRIKKLISGNVTKKELLIHYHFLA